MKPRLLDLFCGLHGWSEGFAQEGWNTIGVDWINTSKTAPGQFIQADLAIWQPDQSLAVDLVIASPPCQEFSRHSMPWTRRKNPPLPSKVLWTRAIQIATRLNAPWILENVKGAQMFMGRSQANYGPFHLWGMVPMLNPAGRPLPKERLSSQRQAERAKVPRELAVWLARVMRPN